MLDPTAAASLRVSHRLLPLYVDAAASQHVIVVNHTQFYWLPDIFLCIDLYGSLTVHVCVCVCVCARARVRVRIRIHVGACVHT